MEQQKQMIEFITNDINGAVKRYNEEAKMMHDEIVLHYNTRGRTKKFLEFRYKRQIMSHQEYYTKLLPDIVVDCKNLPSMCRHYGCIHHDQHRHILSVDDYIPNSAVVSTSGPFTFDHITLFCQRCAYVHYFQKINAQIGLVSVEDLMKRNGYIGKWDIRFKTDTGNNLSDDVLKYITVSAI